MPVREYSKFLIECLEFNDEQAREFNKINNLYKRKAHDITQQMMKIRRAMIQEIVKAESDSLILTDLAEKLGDNHAQLKKLTINYLLSIKNICTPEQRDKLIPLYKKMLSPEPYQRRTFDRKKYGNRLKNCMILTNTLKNLFYLQFNQQKIFNIFLNIHDF